VRLGVTKVMVSLHEKPPFGMTISPSRRASADCQHLIQIDGATQY
jgi:hypothetical protein